MEMCKYNNNVGCAARDIDFDCGYCEVKKVYEKGRADAIEEFVKALEEHQQKNWIDNLEYGITFADIEEVAKQLKEKK